MTSMAPPSSQVLILVVAYSDPSQSDPKGRRAAFGLCWGWGKQKGGLAPKGIRSPFLWFVFPNSESGVLLFISLHQRHSELLLFDFFSFSIILTSLHGNCPCFCLNIFEIYLF